MLKDMLAFDAGEFTTGRKSVFSTQTDPVFGYMGAGDDSNSWTSKVEYEYLYQKITNPLSTSSLSPARQALFGTGGDSHISGVISKGGNVELDPFVIAATTANFDPPLIGDSYSIEFRDQAGNFLKSEEFDLRFEVEIFGDETQFIEIDEAPFVLTLDLPSNAHSVALMQGTNQLVEVSQSPNPPTVQILNVAVDSDNMVTTVWEGLDGDAQSLVYTFFYSPDGVIAKPMAVQITETEFLFDLDEVSPPNALAYVLVRANDGFNYSEDSALLGVIETSLQLVTPDPTIQLAQATTLVSVEVQYSTANPSKPQPHRAWVFACTSTPLS